MDTSRSFTFILHECICSGERITNSRTSRESAILANKSPSVKRRIVSHSCNYSVAHINFIAAEPAGSLMTQSYRCSQHFRCNTPFSLVHCLPSNKESFECFHETITISMAVTFKCHDPNKYLWCLGLFG